MAKYFVVYHAIIEKTVFSYGEQRIGNYFLETQDDENGLTQEKIKVFEEYIKENVGFDNVVVLNIIPLNG